MGEPRDEDRARAEDYGEDGCDTCERVSRDDGCLDCRAVLAKEFATARAYGHAAGYAAAVRDVVAWLRDCPNLSEQMRQQWENAAFAIEYTFSTPPAAPEPATEQTSGSAITRTQGPSPERKPGVDQPRGSDAALRHAPARGPEEAGTTCDACRGSGVRPGYIRADCRACSGTGRAKGATKR